jgi:hypothetical protein
MKTLTWLLAVLIVAPTVIQAQSARLHRGAKVFVASMPDSFDTYLKNAMQKKGVPVEVVARRDDAEFEIKGAAESQKASAAKKIFMGSWHSDEQASISVTDLKSGEIVYAYSANKKNSRTGSRVPRRRARSI